MAGYYMSRGELARRYKSERLQKIGLVVALAVAVVVVGVLSIGEMKADANRKQAITEDNAEALAECWQMVAEGEASSCRLDFVYIDDGQTLIGGEVIAEPKR